MLFRPFGAVFECAGAVRRLLLAFCDYSGIAYKIDVLGSVLCEAILLAKSMVSRGFRWISGLERQGLPEARRIFARPCSLL